MVHLKQQNGVQLRFLKNKKKGIAVSIRKKRSAAAERLMREVVDISQNPAVISGVPEIGMLFEFLEQTGLEVVSPSDEWAVLRKDPACPNFSRFTKEVNREASIVLYPMFLRDARIDKVCHYFTQAVEYASYGSFQNCIIVNMDSEETMRMLACSFLHELGHAQAAFCEGRVGKVQTRFNQERIIEEAAVWSLDCRLMIALGGHEYLTALSELVTSVLQWWRREVRELQWRGKGVALDFPWGVSSRPHVKSERDGTFLIFSQLLATDLYFPPNERLARKAEVLKAVTNGYGYQEREALLKAFAGQPANF